MFQSKYHHLAPEMSKAQVVYYTTQPFNPNTTHLMTSTMYQVPNTNTAQVVPLQLPSSQTQSLSNLPIHSQTKYQMPCVKYQYSGTGPIHGLYPYIPTEYPSTKQQAPNINLYPTELIFGATAATGGRVNFFVNCVNF